MYLQGNEKLNVSPVLRWHFSIKGFVDFIRRIAVKLPVLVELIRQGYTQSAYAVAVVGALFAGVQVTFLAVVLSIDDTAVINPWAKNALHIL